MAALETLLPSMVMRADVLMKMRKGDVPDWRPPYLPLCWLLGLSLGNTDIFPSSRRSLCNACPPWSPISWSLWRECGLFPQSYRPAESGASPSPWFAVPKESLKLLDYIYSRGPSPPFPFLLHSSHGYLIARLPGFISQLCHLLAGRSWIHYLIPLCLSSFICKTGIMIVPLLWGHCEHCMSWECGRLRTVPGTQRSQ